MSILILNIYLEQRTSVPQNIQHRGHWYTPLQLSQKIKFWIAGGDMERLKVKMSYQPFSGSGQNGRKNCVATLKMIKILWDK